MNKKARKRCFIGLLLLMGVFFFTPVTFVMAAPIVPKTQDDVPLETSKFPSKVEGGSSYKVNGAFGNAKQKVNDFNKTLFKIAEAVASVICVYGVYKLGLAMSTHEARDYTASLTVIVISGALANISGWLEQLGDGAQFTIGMGI